MHADSIATRNIVQSAGCATNIQIVDLVIRCTKLCARSALPPRQIVEDMEELVVLVDEADREIGVAGKMAVHRSGELHRAISVFVFDANDRVLLQQRAAAKYHSAGLWSNTCCSHPRPDEENVNAAQRRLREEMGVECQLAKAFEFSYRATFANKLIEHEYDHVYFGRFDGVPRLNPDEAAAWRWLEIEQLAVEVKRHPEAYSFWLAVCLDRVVALRAAARQRPTGAVEAPIWKSILWK